MDVKRGWMVQMGMRTDFDQGGGMGDKWVWVLTLLLMLLGVCIMGLDGKMTCTRECRKIRPSLDNE